jgi:hypothetical protein
VRLLTCQENRLPTVNDDTEPPERNGHGAWDVADPPTELTPREDWVPAEDVFSSPLPSYSNDSPVPELINENQAPGMADSNQSIEENSRHVAFEDPVAGVNEDPAQLSPPTTASASSSTLGRQKWSVNVLRGLFVL